MSTEPSEFRDWKNALLGNIERHEGDLQRVKDDISELKVQIATLRTQMVALVAIAAFVGGGIAEIVARSVWG